MVLRDTEMNQELYQLIHEIENANDEIMLVSKSIRFSLIEIPEQRRKRLYSSV